MAEVLSQDEIDQLLTAINGGDFVGKNSFETIEAFEDYLTKRDYKPEKPYGIFDEDIAMCRFFDSKDNENILEEIRRKNESQRLGNIKIPNTNITLINYSCCPQCKAVYSFNELMNYYLNPKPDARYKNRACQYREDTRICCDECGAYFLPSLIISDGTPKNEVQFLCRVQTIDAVETYFVKKNMYVLTRKKSNIIQKEGLKAIKNDVFLKDLEEKPALVVNMLQYTPINLIFNLVDGTNVEKGDLLFDEWKRMA